MPVLLFLAFTRKSKPVEARISYSRANSKSIAATPTTADATASNAEAVAPAEKEKKKAHPGIFIGSMSVFLAVSSGAITFPFMQSRRDELGCDALCQGGQTSLRSALNLVGASLIGRASDTLGRIPMLWVGIFGTLGGLGVNYTMDSLEGMWLSLVPIALLNQNFSVMKALFSDYIDELGGTAAERAGAVGKLGMAVGFAFMCGPILATLTVKTYSSALVISAAGTCLAAIFLLMLPSPKPAHAPSDAPAGTAASSSAEPKRRRRTSAEKASSGLMDFLRMPVLRTRGAQLLMAVRLLMAFAFHMFMPIWQVSIKTRFNFAPKDHAAFMGCIGLTYALSQGLIAKPAIRRVGSDPTLLLMLCICFLGGARPFALFTPYVGVVFILYVPMVIALGVMNTAITAACSGLAAGDQLGGLFGILESVESIAGMVGPTAGGLLSKTGGEMGTLGAVVSCYGCALLLVALFFHTHVVAPAQAAKAKVA